MLSFANIISEFFYHTNNKEYIKELIYENSNKEYKKMNRTDSGPENGNKNTVK